MRIFVGSPEGASTIEQIEGASLETCHEVAKLLMRATKLDIDPVPPSYEEVQRLINENLTSNFTATA